MIKDVEKIPPILGFLNFFIFQWFFVRLAIGIDPPIKDYITVRRPLFLMKWVFPLSGWFGIPYFPRKRKLTLLVCGIDMVDPSLPLPRRDDW